LPYSEFLKTTVLLAAGEATALALVTIVVVASKGDTATLIFALAWWAVAGLAGAWLGRRAETTRSIGQLLANARPSTSLPQMRPVEVLLNRLWLLAVVAVVSAGVAWVVPQFTAVAAGGAIMVALAWRKQEKAVRAIEERDGVRYYVVPTSPFKPIELMRTSGLKRVVTTDGASA
jgi:hypothetical protein